MDFDLTGEQKMLKESAQKLMKREVAPYLARFPQDRPLTLDQVKALLKKLIPLGMQAFV